MKKRIAIIIGILLLLICTLWCTTLHGNDKIAYDQVSGTLYAFDHPETVRIIQGKPEDEEMGYYQLAYEDKEGKQCVTYYFISIDGNGKYWLYEEKDLEDAQIKAYYSSNIHVDKINKKLK